MILNQLLVFVVVVVCCYFQELLWREPKTDLVNESNPRSWKHSVSASNLKITCDNRPLSSCVSPLSKRAKPLVRLQGGAIARFLSVQKFYPSTYTVRNSPWKSSVSSADLHFKTSTKEHNFKSSLIFSRSRDTLNNYSPNKLHGTSLTAF